jgi:SH3 domain-containing protein
MSRLLGGRIPSTVRRRIVRLSSHHPMEKLAWVLLLVCLPFLPCPLAVASSNATLGTDTGPSSLAMARGIITLTSNLRDAPSMKSGVVGVAKERTTVDILGQTEHWYHIRTPEGLEAWIYKPLVFVEPVAAPQTQTTEVSRPEISPPTEIQDVQDTSTPEPEDISESTQPVAPEGDQQQSSDTPTWPASSLAPAEPLARPSAPTAPKAVSNKPSVALQPVFEPFRGLVGYLLAVLVVVVMVSIGLQWRAARQLRRATSEMGQILDLVEDIYSEVALSRPNTPQAPPAIPATSPAVTLPTLGPEFTPLERALLESLSSGEAIQEGELAKMLQQRGFSGVLIKAVIGDIVRKTAGDGRPWVAVEYTHGRYAYALRTPDGASGREVQQGSNR